MKTIILSILLVFSFGLFAQSIEGTWVTIDDETNKKKSLVKIYKKSDGKLYGKIIKLYRTPSQDQDPICDKCTDDRKNKKIIGMDIIRGLSYTSDDKVWESGTIMDPAKGKEYKAKIWLDENNKKRLNVRGYVAFFYRTQTWAKID
jgi:uncharacterized protein (DUF2147 family)